MITLIVPVALMTLVALLAMALATSVVSRLDTLHPATVNPFAPSIADPSSDTISGDQSMVQTVLAPAHDWQVATFANLSQVEDLLDSLESHGIHSREVIVLTDHCFAVRWK